MKENMQYFHRVYFLNYTLFLKFKSEGAMSLAQLETFLLPTLM